MIIRIIFAISFLFLCFNCRTSKELNNSKKEKIEFNLKVIQAFNGESANIEYRKLYYEVKNNSDYPIYFNTMNFSRDVTDTNGVIYRQGFFNFTSTSDFIKQDCSYCSRGIDFDIYPLNRKDTLDNIVKINAHSSFSDTLRAYGYSFLHDEEGKKESLPYCFKKDKENKNKIKFQLSYDNTLQNVRADTIWKGNLLSNVAVWE